MEHILPSNTNGTRRVSADIEDETDRCKRRRLEDDQTKKRLSHAEYTIGWLCAKPIEMTAACAMLDEEHFPLDNPPGDKNTYVLGSVSGHNVVITCLPSGIYGTNSAATTASKLESTFTSLRACLLVGIGGGVPQPDHDIRIGDVVVGIPSSDHPAIVQYDLGKTGKNGISQTRSQLNNPKLLLLNVASKLQAVQPIRRTQIQPIVGAAIEQHGLEEHGFAYPTSVPDVLYSPECEHVPEDDLCNFCGPVQPIVRPERSSNEPLVHYGTIGSGNQVIKHARTRDLIAKRHGILCFEMEAAGVMNQLQCLVIRGICDYCDGQKQKHFQKYAALVAAAYAKCFLLKLPQCQSTGESVPPCSWKLSQENLASEHRPGHRKALMEALDFDEADSRRLTIKKAHSKTCKWVLHQQQYMDWLDPTKSEDHHGLLWMKGNPATGKSTILKFLLEHTEKHRTKSGDVHVISFFFNARGTELEKSTIGMYRSLLFQLLSQVTELQTLLDGLRPTTNFDESGLELLLDLFRQAINLLEHRKLFCFVDALDECPVDQIREMVEAFEQLCELSSATNSNLQVCFSSRHYPNIVVDTAAQFVLEKQEGHAQDISTYITTELKMGKSRKVEELKAEIFRKSNNVFLWVVLVVSMLKQDFARGRVQDMENHLKEIPSELDNLFKDILMRDTNNLPELVLVIQWVLYAKRPLVREEFYFALLAGQTETRIKPWDREHVTAEVMNNYILDCSKGLTEFTRGKKQTVQFIHESVREFLLKPGALVQLHAVFQNLEAGISHDTLRECCERQLHQDIFAQLQLHLPKCFPIRYAAADIFPLLQYAIGNILRHSNDAQRLGISQRDFMDSLGKSPHWWRFYNDFQTFDKHRVNEDEFICGLASLGFDELCLLYDGLNADLPLKTLQRIYGLLHADQNLSLFKRLISKHFKTEQTHPYIEELYDLLRMVVLTFTRTGRRNFRQAEVGRFLEIAISWSGLQHPSRKDICNLLKIAALEKVPTSFARFMQLYRLNTYTDSHVDIAELAVSITSKPIHRRASDMNLCADTLECLAVIQGDIENLESVKRKVPEMLLSAARWADALIVRNLLDVALTMDQDSPDPALCNAADNGSRESFETLLNVVASSNISARKIDTILHAMADHLEDLAGNEENSQLVYQLVAVYGANINAQDVNGWTILAHAVSKCLPKYVTLLLGLGASASCINFSSENLLHLLAKQICWGEIAAELEAIFDTLIQHKVDMMALNKNSETPLHVAARWGSCTIVRKLLEHGVDVDRQDGEGHTALQTAITSFIWSDTETTFEIILEYDPRLYIVNNRGTTALHMALYDLHNHDNHVEGKTKRRAQCVKLLVQHGAELKLCKRSNEEEQTWRRMEEHMTAMQQAECWVPSGYSHDD